MKPVYSLGVKTKTSEGKDHKPGPEKKKKK